MNNVTFITGNQNKADYLENFLGFPVAHQKLDLNEIQSLDLHEIVEHKIRQAYQQIQAPVMVEDVSLEFTAWSRLPGPLIKWFLEELGFETICRLLDGKDRGAIARSVIGYFDGQTLKMFEGFLPGTIADKPAGEKGFGWDAIFIPEGYSVTRAELSEEDDKKTYLRVKPLKQLKEFLESL